jgi:hypothetical protein
MTERNTPDAPEEVVEELDDEATQETPGGVTIPVPTREQFERDLKTASEPDR